jgi:hypothetical protein
MKMNIDQFLENVHTPDGWDAALALFEQIPEEWVKFFIVAGVRLKKIDIHFPLGSHTREISSEICEIPEEIKKVTFDYAAVDLMSKGYELRMKNK